MVPQRDLKGQLSEVLYSRGFGALWVARLRPTIGGLLIAAILVFAVSCVFRQDFKMFAGALACVIPILIVAMHERRYIYDLRLTGSTLSLSTAFSHRELSILEVKDLYQPACQFSNANVWELKTAESSYEILIKDSQSRDVVQTLLSKIQDRPSTSWLDYKMSSSLERKMVFPILLPLMVLLLCVWVGAVTPGIICLLVVGIAAGALSQIAREVQLKPDGIEVTNMFRTKKMISWSSIKSVRVIKVGTVFLESTQGKRILSTVDGFNVLVDKIFKQIPNSLYIDDNSGVRKLTRR